MGETSGEARGFTALLEAVQRDYKVLAEGQQDTRRKIDQTAQESEKRDRALDETVNLHSPTLLQRLDEVKSLVDGVSAKIDGTSSQVQALADRLNAHEHTHAA